MYRFAGDFSAGRTARRSRRQEVTETVGARRVLYQTSGTCPEGYAEGAKNHASMA